ncbi:hypothetical protein EHM76_06340 [bacterium]|nr:MAG: hypothetical protein EHM76_06340 [bacterium]
MKKNITAISVLVMLSVLLSACNLSAANPTQIGPDQINTIAAQTVEALTTQMAPPPATATNTPEPATATPMVTATSTLAIPTLNLTPGALTNTLIPLPTSAGSTECNKVFFLEDTTIKDGTVFKPETEFTKTWKIQNSGSCTWTTLYSAVPFSNDPASPAITGDGEFPVKANVAPGGLLQITVKMFAPKEEGTYTQYWKMQDDAGNNFGIGGAGGAGWYVNIKVDKDGVADTSDKVTGTTVNAEDEGGGTFTLSGSITTNDKLSVRAYWRVDGKAVGINNDLAYLGDVNGTVPMIARTFDCGVAGITARDVTATVYFGDPASSQVTGTQTDTISCP